MGAWMWNVVAILFRKLPPYFITVFLYLFSFFFFWSLLTEKNQWEFFRLWGKSDHCPLPRNFSEYGENLTTVHCFETLVSNLALEPWSTLQSGTFEHNQWQFDKNRFSKIVISGKGSFWLTDSGRFIFPMVRWTEIGFKPVRKGTAACTWGSSQIGVLRTSSLFSGFALWTEWSAAYYSIFELEI